MQTMSEGDDLYVDLGGEENPSDPNAPLMAMMHQIQREMMQLKNHNERLSLSSNEKERLIRELTSWNSHEGDGYRRKRKRTINHSKESEEDEAFRQQSRRNKEL